MYSKTQPGWLRLSHLVYYEGQRLKLDAINLDYMAGIVFNKWCDGKILFTIILRRKFTRVCVEVVAPTGLLVAVSWVSTV